MRSIPPIRSVLISVALFSAMMFSAVSSNAEEPAPLTEEDLEFLEFLAEFDTGDEDWTDPLELEVWQRGVGAAKKRVRHEGEHNDIND